MKCSYSSLTVPADQQSSCVQESPGKQQPSFLARCLASYPGLVVDKGGVCQIPSCRVTTTPFVATALVGPDPAFDCTEGYDEPGI